jgi:hypothetical protein
MLTSAAPSTSNINDRLRYRRHLEGRGGHATHRASGSRPRGRRRTPGPLPRPSHRDNELHHPAARRSTNPFRLRAAGQRPSEGRHQGMAGKRWIDQLRRRMAYSSGEVSDTIVGRSPLVEKTDAEAQSGSDGLRDRGERDDSGRLSIL